MADGEGASTPLPTLNLAAKTKTAAKMDWIAELADDLVSISVISSSLDKENEEIACMHAAG
jgi:hypothetical protein